MKRTRSGQKRQGEQLSSQVARRRSRRSNPTSHTSVSTDDSAVVELSSNTTDINTIVKNKSTSIMPQIESTVRRVVESHLSGLGLVGCEKSSNKEVGLPVVTDKYGTDNVSVSTLMVISNGLRDGGDSSLVTGSGTTPPSSSGNNFIVPALSLDFTHSNAQFNRGNMCRMCISTCLQVLWRNKPCRVQMF